MHSYQKTVFIFRRDLRLDDNTALLAACKASKSVLACFIFDPQQVGKENTYRSMNAIQFIIASLEDLDEQLKKKGGKLHLFYGNAPDVINKIIKDENIEALFCNKDYTPFSIKRDKEIADICKKAGIIFEQYDDALLNPPETVLTKSGTPYSIFTPYWKSALQHKVEKPTACRYTNFLSGNMSSSQSRSIFKKILPETNKQIAQKGGRTHALKKLKNLAEFKHYQKTRDIPALPTTELSAHIKFGTVSIREVYYALLEHIGRSAHEGLIRQLYWHDFYYQIAYHWPHVFGKPFKEQYNNINWHYSKKDFARWCEGTTGFPIVDAGMRQLNSTGYMHNRVRMIVASFLTKDLLIDWRWGEKYFAQQLVDYDPCVNNGNWQWASSTGCDPQPYFRIFNPWLQQKKFDPECIYIKTWVDELKDVDCKVIHNWFKDDSPELDYPRPMVDHSEQKEKALKMFKNAR